MDEEFSAENWFEGLASLLLADNHPSWCKSVYLRQASIAITVADYVIVEDLVVDKSWDAIIVHYALDSQSLVVRDISIDASTSTAKCEFFQKRVPSYSREGALRRTGHLR